MKRSEVPDDNSHFPVTIKPGERFFWWATRNVKDKNTGAYNEVPTLKGSPKNLLDNVTSDGHVPTLTVEQGGHWRGRIYLHGSMRCSCGYEIPRVGFGTTGKFYSGFMSSWNGHKDKLAAPMQIWEAKSARTTYTCWIAQQKHLTSLGAVDHWGNSNGYYNNMFFVVRQSSTKGAQAKVLGTYRSLMWAQQYAQKIGLKQEEKDRQVTWTDERPVQESTGEASAILTALDRAKDPAAIQSALKVADDFLTYSELIREKRDELLRRFDAAFDLDLADVD